MSEALVKIEEERAIVRQHPSEVIRQATEEANVLAEVIEGQKLFSLIQGKRFVRCEGWVTLATLRGCLPREVSVTEMPEGRYVAEVELVRMSDGTVLTKASSECGGPEDPVWQKRPPNARRSMAITRATGKACRVAFSWVMAMSGFEVTPAEEMIADVVEAEVVKHTPRPAPKPIASVPTPEGVQRFVGTVVDCELKSGEKNGRAWSKYGVQLVNEHGEKSGWLGTFDKPIGDAATRLKDGGDIAEAWYVDDGKFKTLTDISAVIFEK